MKHWTTDEQQAWIEAQAAEFLRSQTAGRVSSFMSSTTEKWFELFPNTMPAEVSPKELDKAKGNLQKAKVEKKKTVSA